MDVQIDSRIIAVSFEGPATFTKLPRSSVVGFEKCLNQPYLYFHPEARLRTRWRTEDEEDDHQENDDDNDQTSNAA